MLCFFFVELPIYEKMHKNGGEHSSKASAATFVPIFEFKQKIFPSSDANHNLHFDAK